MGIRKDVAGVGKDGREGGRAQGNLLETKGGKGEANVPVKSVGKRGNF